MVSYRQEKINRIVNEIPDLEIFGDQDADLLVVGWGGTFGHLYSAVALMREAGKKVAFVHFHWISPLPKNTADVLRKFKKIVVAEQNSGQLAGYLRMKIENLPHIYQYNKIQGQPFQVKSLKDAFTKIMEDA